MSIKPADNCCDEKIIRELFTKHARDLYKFLYYRFGSENNPKDLVQDAFVKLWDNCQKVKPEKARSYLFTVANNQMLNNLEKKKTVLKYYLYVSRENDFESPDLDQDLDFPGLFGDQGKGGFFRFDLTYLLIL